MDRCQFLFACENSDDIDCVCHYGEQHKDAEEDDPHHAGQLSFAMLT